MGVVTAAAVAPADVDLDTALRLLALPRDIGKHPETGDAITAGLGRFGPYLKHGAAFKSLAAEDDVLTIGLNRAVSLLAEPSKGRQAAQPLRTVGQHPDDGAPIQLFKGRYGPYVSHDGLFATIPGSIEPESLTLEAAIELLKAQEAKGKKRKSQRGKKPPTKTKGAKARTAKKAAGAKTDSAKAGKAEAAPGAETKPAAHAKAKKKPAAGKAAKSA